MNTIERRQVSSIDEPLVADLLPDSATIKARLRRANAEADLLRRLLRIAYHRERDEARLREGGAS
jgi:hypothetical protein